MAYGIRRRNHDLWWEAATGGWTNEQSTARRFTFYAEAVLAGLSEGRLSPYSWEVAILAVKPGEDGPPFRVMF